MKSFTFNKLQPLRHWSCKNTPYFYICMERNRASLSIQQIRKTYNWLYQMYKISRTFPQPNVLIHIVRSAVTQDLPHEREQIRAAGWRSTAGGEQHNTVSQEQVSLQHQDILFRKQRCTALGLWLQCQRHWRKPQACTISKGGRGEV